MKPIFLIALIYIISGCQQTVDVQPTNRSRLSEFSSSDDDERQVATKSPSSKSEKSDDDNDDEENETDTNDQDNSQDPLEEDLEDDEIDEEAIAREMEQKLQLEINQGLQLYEQSCNNCQLIIQFHLEKCGPY